MRPPVAGLAGDPGGVLLPAQGAAGDAGMVSAIFVFLVSLLVGTVAINAGARMLIDRDSGYGRAVLTALVGAVVYTLAGFFLAWVPFLGPLLMLLAWVWVINVVYPGGWGTAVGIGVVAWVVAVVLLVGLAQFDVVTPDALGIPGA